jgi:peptide/nickel transport system substrate-binding protein
VVCGFLFLAALSIAACHGLAGSPQTSRPPALTVGVPEGTASSTEVGVAEWAQMLTVEGLTQVNADGRVLPRVAEKWAWENGGRTLRVFLRNNVRFHDGTALTATTMVDIIRRLIARPGSRDRYPSLNDITSVAPDGDSQVVFTLSAPSAFLLEDLSAPIQSRDGAGTGPYRVTKREKSEIVLDRFEQYYLGSPSIGKVVIRPFDALRTTWTSLLRGEVDMVAEVPPDSIEFIESADVQTFSFPHWYQFILAFELNKSPFNSPAVRRALNLGVDRDALITSALKGHATPSTGPIWPKHWAVDNTIQGFVHDSASAVALLEAAGFHKGTAGDNGGVPDARLRFTCLIPMKFSLLERLGLEIQRQLYDIGVDMQFEAVPIDEYLARIAQGKFEAILVDMISGPSLVRPYLFWRSARTYKGLNVFGYDNPEAERQFQALRTAMNEAAVRSATARLQRVLMEDPPAVFLAWNERARVVRREFQVVHERGRDPMSSLWRWSVGAAPVQTASLP